MMLSEYLGKRPLEKCHNELEELMLNNIGRAGDNT